VAVWRLVPALIPQRPALALRFFVTKRETAVLVRFPRPRPAGQQHMVFVGGNRAAPEQITAAMKPSQNSHCGVFVT
jgi:hypothetical protein